MSRDPGPNRQEIVELIAVMCRLQRHDWPRPDEGHVSLQHVPELRQLIEAAATEESAEASNPRIQIRWNLEMIAHVMVPQQFVLEDTMLGTGDHRPKLQTIE